MEARLTATMLLAAAVILPVSAAAGHADARCQLARDTFSANATCQTPLASRAAKVDACVQAKHCVPLETTDCEVATVSFIEGMAVSASCQETDREGNMSAGCEAVAVLGAPPVGSGAAGSCNATAVPQSAACQGEPLTWDPERGLAVSCTARGRLNATLSLSCTVILEDDILWIDCPDRS